MKKIGILSLLCAFIFMANAQERDFTKYVNLFVGTADHGHTHPAAVVPNGMIQPGPDTRFHEWDACSGYYYEDQSINGFAHTRLSGTGCADYGDFLLMPIVGRPDLQYIGEKEPLGQRVAFASPFCKSTESAEPGYYTVVLDRYRVKAELTATERAALHRYTYPKATEAGMILDLDYGIHDQVMPAMDIEIVDNQTIRAYRRSQGWAYNQQLYFYAKFSKPFTAQVVRDTVKTSKRTEPRCKVILKFSTNQDEQVMVKTSISMVDYEGAKKNLMAEIPGWDFDGVRAAAKQKWNKVLSKIEIPEVEGEFLKEHQQVFYTALYHANISPALATDVDGRYKGMDLKIYQADPASPNYTVYSLWDTHRALHPLLTILSPKQNQAYIRNLIRKGEEGGIVPKWELASNYTGCMIGYHFTSLAADAYAKGHRNFDANKALAAGVRMAEYDTAGITQTLPKWKLTSEIMPPARKYKNEMGYAPYDCDHETVAKALEYAYNDWCIATLANGVKNKAVAEKYYKFGKAYQHYFDPTTQFMRGKDAQGNWRTPFDPRSSRHRADDYCEGTAWQWTWFVPHDVDGLVALMGSKENFANKLDGLFSAPSGLTGDDVSPDVSGFIGQYAHGNEPGHHTTHLYNYVGRPWRTQELVDSVLINQYRNAPAGISGNEDCGQMSAWYILNAMGFYQVCPGNPTYSIGRPLFPEVTINLENGKKFTIVTKGNSRKAKYIKSAKLNGKALKKPFFTHKQLEAGGTLELVMSEVPTQWGK